jgi:hypothetical protein
MPTVLRFIEPCLPSPADRPPSGTNWIHEIKHDGYRLMARRDSVGTRRGNDWSSRFPLVVEAVNYLKVRSCLIDGEVVCCDEKGVPAFQMLRHRHPGVPLRFRSLGAERHEPSAGADRGAQGGATMMSEPWPFEDEEQRRKTCPICGAEATPLPRLGDFYGFNCPTHGVRSFRHRDANTVREGEPEPLGESARARQAPSRDRQATTNF